MSHNGTTRASFVNKLQEGIGVCLFGIVPPPEKVKEEKVAQYAQQFANSVRDLEGLDGVNM